MRIFRSHAALRADLDTLRQDWRLAFTRMVAIPPAPDGPPEMRLADSGHINTHKWTEIRLAAIEDQLGLPHPWDQQQDTEEETA